MSPAAALPAVQPVFRNLALEGRPVFLVEFKGKPTVVNLWATWCPPCVREMPTLHQAQVDRPGVNFVFLNQGESADKVSAWLRARMLPMRNVLMDETAASGRCVQATRVAYDAVLRCRGKVSA